MNMDSKPGDVWDEMLGWCTPSEKENRERRYKDMNLQERYQKGHNEGIDIAFAFVQEIKSLVGDILTVYQEDCDPEVITIIDSDTFESAWIDDQGRPCCAATLDDGAPMGWRVDFLDLHHKRELHDLLHKMRNELRRKAVQDERPANIY